MWGSKYYHLHRSTTMGKRNETLWFNYRCVSRIKALKFICSYNWWRSFSASTQGDGLLLTSFPLYSWFFNAFANWCSLPSKDAGGNNVCGLVAITPHRSKKGGKGCYWGLYNVRYMKSYILSQDRSQLYLIQDIVLQDSPKKSSKSNHRATEHDLSTAWNNWISSV